jgi:ubiquinone/menaquinone biosynthesis C-methylase UbiE
VKVRESGMPEQAVWESFFDPPAILQALGLTNKCLDALEFGCGYGTFTTAAATIITGTIHALDIDETMLRKARAKGSAVGLTNIKYEARDFLAQGCGFPTASVDYAMLFNILHTEDPVGLLREARRVLRSAGMVGVIHWNHDPLTPRGPPMEMRPRPDDCVAWAQAAGFACSPVIDLPPYHYGVALTQTG